MRKIKISRMVAAIFTVLAIIAVASVTAVSIRYVTLPSDREIVPSSHIAENNRIHGLYSINDGDYCLTIESINRPVKICGIAGTGSMRPTLCGTSKILTVSNFTEDELCVGDIICFEKDDSSIAHRIVAKGYDLQGVYFITKGDNCKTDDGKIRMSQIKRLVIGILY